MPSEKFALITGCGKGGIGHALANCLQVKGYTVIATLLPNEASDHLKAKGINFARADVTSEESIRDLQTFVESVTNGKLDVLINNAGIAYTMTAVDTDVKQVEKMFAVNVFGPMRMVNVFHHELIASKGKVVNISSIGGICPYLYGAAYNASKAALIHWGNTLRVEMLPFEVKVVNIISGEVGTNILKNDFNRKLPEGIDLLRAKSDGFKPPLIQITNTDSVYSPMADAFQAHVKRTPDTMTPEQYAEGVIGEITRDNPRPWFWYGNATFLVWFVDTFVGQRGWDLLFWRMFNLKALAAAVAKH